MIATAEKTAAPANYYLSQEEIEFFHENGYLGPFKLFEPKEAKELWERMLRPQLFNRSRAVYRDSVLNYDRHLDNPILNSIVCDPRIVHRLNGIMGSNLLSWRTEWFPKYPGDEGTEWHQAKHFYEFEGVPKLMPTDHSPRFWGMTAWIAFTESDMENGCIKVMPKTHKTWYFDESRTVKHDKNVVNQKHVDEEKRGFFGYDWEKLKIDPKWKADESQAKYLEMNAGEFFIFTSQCMHGSAPNTSKNRSRFAMSSRYCTTDVRVYPDQTEYASLGETLSLERYRTILVSGEDTFKYNRSIPAYTLPD
jgi:chlorinating enzyme